MVQALGTSWGNGVRHISLVRRGLGAPGFARLSVMWENPPFPCNLDKINRRILPTCAYVSLLYRVQGNWKVFCWSFVAGVPNPTDQPYGSTMYPPLSSA